MKKRFLFTVALLCAVAQGTWAQTRVNNENELAQAVKTNGASIVLMSDFELSQPVTIQGDNGGAVTVTINMNGKKLTYKKSVGQTTASCVFIVPAASVLNLSNGTIADVSNVSGNNTEYVAAALVNNGTATLDAVTISGCKGLKGGAIKNNENATLNLKSCTFDRNEAVTNSKISDSGNGGAIWNDGKISISKSENLTFGVNIQNGDAVYGAGIYNGGKGVITMSNNSPASFLANKASADGGAIYNLGSVSLTAQTTLNQNHAANNAGAIWNGGTLNLRGCDFMGNGAQNGAAVYISSGASVKINGGNLTNNIAGINGGVVYCDGVLGMDAITFNDNKAGNNKTEGNGGAIYVSSAGTVALSDSTGVGNKMNNNSASKNGGAIYAGGKLEIGGITATANTANAGGMIYIDGNGNVTLKANTSITENKSNTQGGAIYDAGTLAISGKIAVKQNTGANEAASNVYLTSGKVMNVTGSLSASNIGVLLADTTGVFTSGYNSTNSGTDPSTFFTSDYYQQFYGVTLSKNEALLDVKSPIMIAEESVLRQALDMFDKVSVKLSNDIKLSNSTLEIKSGKTVTLDLGGFTLDRGRTSREWNTGGQVITVRKGGTLNLSNGTLTGGWGGNSGGLANEEGTANLTDVTITGCTGDDRGGGISNYGTLTIKGGAITNNISNDKGSVSGGGGIFNASGATATLTGVTLTGNQAKGTGGGGICNLGTLTVDGCTIKNNIAKTEGGGIWTENGVTLNMKGANTISDNTTANGATNNLFLRNGALVTVTGSLAGSNVGIKMENYLGTFTSGYKTNNSDVAPTTVFKADNAVVFVPALSGNEAALTLQPLIKAASDADLRLAVSFDGANIQLGSDIQMSNSTLVIGGGKTVTIDLNGKTLDRGLKSGAWHTGGQVITVREGATLNLTGGTLTGGYGGNGGAIENSGTANLTDVNITDNRAEHRGGAIANHGTLNMTGGSITNNFSNDTEGSAGGGAIFAHSGSNTTLTGVTITGNQAKGAGGGGVNNWGTATIDGCTITGNTSSANGGGVWSGPSSTLNMQGKNTVTDNEGNGNVNNVYLRDGVVITVTGSLEGSQIGIRMANPGTFTSGYSTNNKDVAPIKYFLSDADGYIVKLNGNEVELRKNMEVGINSVESSKAADGTWYDMNGRRLDGKPTQKGVYINNGVKVIVK